MYLYIGLVFLSPEDCVPSLPLPLKPFTWPNSDTLGPGWWPADEHHVVMGRRSVEWFGPHLRQDAEYTPSGLDVHQNY